MEDHWERIRTLLNPLRSQNEASVSLPLPAQRSPTPSVDFFQRDGENNNNILSSNPFDQRRPSPAIIWFAPLSSLLRPDILPTPLVSSVPAPAPAHTPTLAPAPAPAPAVVSPPPPPPPQPHVNQKVTKPRSTSALAPLREVEDFSPEDILYTEALGFLHSFLASNLMSKPQSSKVGCLRLHQDYQRLSKQRNQRYVIPAEM